MSAGRALFCLTAGAATLAGGLIAADPARAAKAESAGRAPSSPPASSSPERASPQKPAATQRFDIDDFAVQGADTLPQIEIEEAIYPFLGPNKTADDVEKARAALEKAYHDKGYQTVSVSVPQQNALSRMITLKVTEMKVGRLRVKNSRYFDLAKITNKAGSLKEGTVPNFNEVTKDIVALNQWPDRRVTPALRAGVTPGTVDVDLNVEDKVPVHASVELNNRQSPNTTALRLSSTVHYDNLWQLGHSLSFTYQVAPQRPGDAEVFSGSYLARLQDVDWLSVLVYAVKSSSNVATVGGTNVIGPGQILGSRAVMTLPTREGLFHTLSAGVDYKHFDQTVKLGGDGFSSPVTYYPVVASYGATFQAEKFTTQFNAAVTYNLRPLSDDWVAFDTKRYQASPSFTHFNVDVSHTQELPEGFQLYGKIQGQVADGPLVSSEQISAGGLDTVRGYLESETLGDNGVIGNLELRSPNIGELLQKQMKNETGQGQAPFTVFNDWRFFGFTDAGTVTVLHPLPDQQSKFDVWSYGVGARFKMFDYLNGTLVYSVPMVSQAYTEARNPRVNFRIWGEF
ncbi:ShlB/FhaC/HecB family hemolysin secretion/activation protein [Bradyrhizobium sp. WSM 1738]|uniref:ShlB/FhaC/HecB family hemolysin secretion/activation protein n=1 Tax=Bradyrhizobium hereditatis TaxID=2821405 RepID=UPI001CE29134|nr:ShlB/FhaC/HecB family hemolysin secretion/activation protein [Bradyrhizobium hereditatis]MCA6116435.1 ShlB/FhaC/HecB family hemolysin secretion/activation protein [Bradyrhizobium hereditatis]